jgi:RNA polymerase sigma-70 factor (ECF subfamily)
MSARPELRVVNATPVARAPREPVSFDALFHRYAKYVAGVAFRLLGRDDDEVDDVVQDVFWIASRNLGRIYDLDAARPWLVTVAVRVVCRKLRRQRWKRMFVGEAPLANVPAPGVTPEERVLLARVYRVLDTVASGDRIAWLLRHVEGERLEDVAVACRCSLATAKRRIAAVESVLDEVLRDA